jgi:hypothetical protein
MGGYHSAETKITLDFDPANESVLVAILLAGHDGADRHFAIPSRHPGHRLFSFTLYTNIF